MTTKLSRRNFLIASGLAAASGPLRFARGANDDVRVAVLGCGTRGGQLIPMFGKAKGVRIVAVCDPDRGRAEEKAKLAAPHNAGKAVDTESDLRRVLDRDDVDAVVVATPNHWHALASIWAIQAGKDVYCEKPVAYDLWESRQLVDAAGKHNKIVQAGTHRRSYENLAKLFERVRAGEFGAVTRGHAIVSRQRGGIGRRETPLPIPDGVDYDLWAGPAAKVPLYRDAFHYDWHWVWNTGNGELGNNGPHVLDLVRWALGQDRLAPAVLSVGGRFGVNNDVGETPNTQVVYYDYKPAPVLIEIRNLTETPGSKAMENYKGIKEGWVIECANADIVGLGGAEIRDKAGKVIETIAEVRQDADHPANFIGAVRSRKVEDLNCPITVAHVSCGLCLQGNISHKVGASIGREQAEAATRSDPALADATDRMLSHLEANKVRVDGKNSGLILGPMLAFDPSSERFTGDLADQANAHMKRASYRGSFVVPEIA